MGDGTIMASAYCLDAVTPMAYIAADHTHRPAVRPLR